MEDNPRLLWGYVETALRPRRTAADASWLQGLNRIYREALCDLALPPAPALGREACDIVNEHWSGEQVARTPRAPAFLEGAPQIAPMIAVRSGDGRCVLIHGAARAELIAANGAPGPHSVVVIVAAE